MTLSATHRLAFAWAAVGARVFPVLKDKKKPAYKRWQSEAIGPNEMDRILDYFKPDHGVGIACGPSRLLVVDFDIDPERWVLTQMLPETYTQRTPRGGEHRYFWVPEGRDPRSSGSKLADGIDIRARGGMVVARYAPPDNWPLLVSTAPGWLLEMCEILEVPKARGLAPEEVQLRRDEILAQAVLFLTKTAPPIKAPGVNPKTYKLVLCLRDIGVEEEDAYSLLSKHWNGVGDNPQLIDADLRTIVRKAYTYARGGIGADNPSPKFIEIRSNGDKTTFPDDHPFMKMNEQFAYVLCGSMGRILHEDGKRLKFMGSKTFEELLAPYTFPSGNKLIPLTKAWMQWPGRRTYHDLVFKPNEKTDEREYNLWKGFAVEPADADTPLDGLDGVKMWLELIQKIYCRGDKRASEWLLGYFAHLMQFPGEKPLVGVVLQSRGKGTGKNAGVERICEILGPHGMVSSRRRYIDGNFNAHMERCLMLVLDEAFWSRGAKEAQAILQDMITGQHHYIEPKGVDAYPIKNLTRVFLLSNNDWVVPASPDERRYAVFEVSEDRKQDREWFHRMRILLNERQGNRWLLRYLLDRPISDVSYAPKTLALREQILENLDPVDSWWLESLQAGKLLELDVQDWPNLVEKDRVRESIYRHYAYRGWRGVKPSFHQITRSLRRLCPEIELCRLSSEGRPRGYRLPSFERCRFLWEKHVGGWIWGDIEQS